MSTTFDPGAWTGMSTANLSDVVGRVGAMEGGIHRVTGTQMAGPAHTVLTGTGDSSTIHRALAEVDAGSVLVVDAQGGIARAVWGAIMTVAAVERGVVGVVIDGAVRDLDEIAGTGLPIFARAACPAGPHKGFRGTHAVTVQCGGVVVNQGDIVVGDADGVAVVPAGEAESALAAVKSLVAREREWINRIRSGETTVEVLGLD